MTISAGRRAIETFWLANWDEAAAVTVGLGGLPATVTRDMCPAVRLTIRETTPRAISVGGSDGKALIGYLGIATASIFTDGGLGDEGANPLCDAVIDLFHGITLDEDGLPVTTSGQAAFVRFCPPEAAGAELPYVASITEEPPLRITNVVAPLVRYQRR